MVARLCCAYLRAYRNVASLTGHERVLVERAREVRSDPAPRRHSLGLLAAEERRELYSKMVDGTEYVCLGQNRMRSLLGLVSFEQSLPDAVIPSFFTESELARARAELERIQRQQNEVRQAIVQSVWHVPLRWFVCFSDAERRIEQAGDHPTIRYQTRVRQARERTAGAQRALAGGIVHPVIVGMIYELTEWLSVFDDDAVLELDYASVARLFDADILADDHSAADVWRAIEALAEGDGMKAGLYYQRVNERWAAARRRIALN